MIEHKKWVGALLLFSVIPVFLDVGVLFAQSSANYKIRKSVINQSGAVFQSSNHRITDAIGQPSIVGQSQSANFQIISGFLAESRGIMISAPNITGVPGATIDIPITITDITGKNILSLSMTIETQTTILTPVSASITSTMLEPWGSITTNIIGGKIIIAGAGTTPLTGSGNLLFLKYLVNPAAQNGQTSIIDLVSAVLNEGSPRASLKDGLITITAGFNISGVIQYYSGDKPVPNTTVNLNGFQTLTNTMGAFSFANLTSGNYALTPTKDGDLGASITAYDASYILRYVVGLTSLTPYQMIAADVSGNGNVSALDASWILRYIVGLVSQFPVADDWAFVPTSYPINNSNWNVAPRQINYTPLNSDQSNQDFKGIVYGDVSGNWLVLGEQLAVTPPKVNGLATIGWGKITSSSQQHFQVPIQATITGDLFSAEIKIVFNPTVLDLAMINLDEKLISYHLDYHLKDGELNIALAGAEPITSEVNLMRLKFEVLDPEFNEVTFLELQQVSFNEGLIGANLLEKRLSFKPAIPTSTQLFQNYPNPFNSETVFAYQLHKREQVRLEVINLLGQKIRTLWDQEQSPGSYTIHWDGRDDNGAIVGSGVYLYRIKAGKFVCTKKLAVVK